MPGALAGTFTKDLYFEALPLHGLVGIGRHADGLTTLIL